MLPLHGAWVTEATPARPNALLWLFRCTSIFKFRVKFKVSIRFRVKLHYIMVDSVRLKVLLARLKVPLTRLTSVNFVHPTTKSK